HLGDVPLLGGLLSPREPAGLGPRVRLAPAAHARGERVPGAGERLAHARPGGGARVDGDRDRRRLRGRRALGQAARPPLIAGHRRSAWRTLRGMRMRRQAGALILYGGWLLLFNPEANRPDAPLSSWKKRGEYDTGYLCEQARSKSVADLL